MRSGEGASHNRHHPTLMSLAAAFCLHVHLPGSNGSSNKHVSGKQLRLDHQLAHSLHSAQETCSENPPPRPRSGRYQNVSLLTCHPRPENADASPNADQAAATQNDDTGLLFNGRHRPMDNPVDMSYVISINAGTIGQRPGIKGTKVCCPEVTPLLNLVFYRARSRGAQRHRPLGLSRSQRASRRAPFTFYII